MRNVGLLSGRAIDGTSDGARRVGAGAGALQDDDAWHPFRRTETQRRRDMVGCSGRHVECERRRLQIAGEGRRGMFAPDEDPTKAARATVKAIKGVAGPTFEFKRA